MLKLKLVKLKRSLMIFTTIISVSGSLKSFNVRENDSQLKYTLKWMRATNRNSFKRLKLSLKSHDLVKLIKPSRQMTGNGLMIDVWVQWCCTIIRLQSINVHCNGLMKRMKEVKKEERKNSRFWFLFNCC